MSSVLITPCRNHIYVLPIDEEVTPGGIALPRRRRDEAEGMSTYQGEVFAYSLMALRQMEESIGRDKMHRWHEGALIEYFGHSTTRISGVEFHVIKPVDVWAILTED